MEKTNAAKEYLHRKKIPQLFENMMLELISNQPEDHIEFLQQFLKQKQELPNDSKKIFGEEKAEVKDNKTVEESSSSVGKPIVFVLGGPGSGKGTQCERIVEEFGFAHFSAGDLLREEVAKGTEQGKKIEEAMKQGQLVPPEWTIALLKGAMESKPDTKGYLIDGFPRKLDQAEKFEDQIRPCALVLMFECNEDVMVQRLLQRGQTSGRVDDNEETIRKRLKIFQEATLPVIEHYNGLGKVAKINSEQSIEEVYSNVQKVFQKF